MPSDEIVLATQRIGQEDATVTTPTTPKPISVSIDAVRNNVTSSFSTGDTGSIRFAIGDDVLIDVITTPAVTTKFSNFGSLFLSFTTTKVITELIAVVDEDEFTLQHFPLSGFSASFVGTFTGGSGISLDGNKGIMSAKAFGLVEAIYTVAVKVYKLTSGKDTTLIAFLNQDGSKGSVTVTFEPPDPCDSTTVANVIVIAKNNKDSTLIEGASVTIDGVSQGFTDSNGELNVGSLVKGRTYQIKITKTGFINTDLDCLKNESFTL